MTDLTREGSLARDFTTPRTRSATMPNSAHGEPIEILLVEDDPDDADLTIGALRKGRVQNRVTLMEDGVEAMAYLRREGPHAEAPRPDLVLLDLNLPRKNGLEVLAEIRQDPRLRRLPVVMMTRSEEEKHNIEAYNRHVNCYVIKPVDLAQFLTVVRSIEHFWFSIVTLPAA
jgi:CheY-like chemotaxis protein